MTYQFYCQACQSDFTVDQLNTNTTYSLNGASKLTANCPKCQMVCDMANTDNHKEQDFDEFMQELQRRYGGGCRGGGCSCN